MGNLRCWLIGLLWAGMCGVAWGQAGAPPGLERWFYYPTNLQVDANVAALEKVFHRAGKAGYTHALLADSKSAKLSDLGDMTRVYFANIEKVKRIAAANRVEIVPAVFPVGYSEAILWHDPNLAEGLPVRDALLIVQGGVARPAADPAVQLRGGDMADLSRWDWKDPDVVTQPGGAAVSSPAGNARLVQKVKVAPYRQYHISVQVKTAKFTGTPEVKVLGKVPNATLNWAHLGVKPTQDWTTHHAVFNSLENAEVTVYLGVWGGAKGDLWWREARIEESPLVNLIRREGAPLVVQREGAAALQEGVDYEPLTDPGMGRVPWKGSFDVYHEPPILHTRGLPDETRLRLSCFHAITVYDNQVMICPSEPRTLELLRDQARRVHAAWGAKAYFMSHDEIRVLNWDDACRRRGLEPGAILAENVRACASILREVNPGGRILVWSDMFDPHHNARGDYYLVRGDLSGSWEGLNPDVIVALWHYDKRAQSAAFFAQRGHPLLIAGYYDGPVEQIKRWTAAVKQTPGARLTGVMYTTWRRNYDDLERFSAAVEEGR